MKRFNVEIQKDRQEEINNMIADAGLRTNKELFDNAITLFSWVIKQRKKGYSIGSYNEEKDTFNELTMPSLEFIKKTD